MIKKILSSTARDMVRDAHVAVAAAKACIEAEAGGRPPSHRTTADHALAELVEAGKRTQAAANIVRCGQEP